ncbi:FkbM family methyltransferase [Xenophilus aerolatus]|nr:FkbM family methyltransferase [Xenophilus aerolatus]
MGMLRAIQSMTRRFGVDVVPYNAGEHPVARRQRLMEISSIDTVLDIGANRGQFGVELRRMFGYRGRIISFEPLSTAFRQLEITSRHDQNWKIFNWALGEQRGIHRINIASNSESSSLLEMLGSHLEAAPQSKYIGSETVHVETLDDIFEQLCVEAQSIYMKIDTQGYETQVLRGAKKSLSLIDTIQLEMSLTPLYNGQPLFNEICTNLIEQGYCLVGLENNFGNAQTGRLLQVDGIFRRYPPS